MLRKFLNFQLSLSAEGKPLHRLRPLFVAIDNIFYEPFIRTQTAPHIRDAIDLKRWMIIVVYALFPCILMAIWNSGLQKFVYGSGNQELMQHFHLASHSFSGYFSFAFKDQRYLTILKEGAIIFLPILVISYIVGGFWEVLFASIRGHEISEGFLVTGILFSLILPSTIPYWMIAVGVSAGVVIGKEIFGGTGMNILNPALIARCFLFFAFPAQMSGDVWVGSNSTHIKQSLKTINQNQAVDGYTQASALGQFNLSLDVKKIHVDAIATHLIPNVATKDPLEIQFKIWESLNKVNTTLANLSHAQMKDFVTSPFNQGGLALSPENYSHATQFTLLKYGQNLYSNGNLFFGNKIGSLGEISTLAVLLGAILLIYTSIGAWRTMIAVTLGTLVCAFIFQYGATLGPDQGAWNPAKFDFPPYKHLLLGGLAFGLVFMATDPVSSPTMKVAKWLYGFLIGALVIIIRLVNPAFPEGVMLAILFGNVFAPLFDHYALSLFRKVRRARAKKIIYS